MPEIKLSYLITSTVAPKQEFEGDDMDGLCDQLKEMATESHKYKSKKDRRTQRSSFRQILDAILLGAAPSVVIKFSKEALVIDSWARKWQYECLCHTLGSGMNVHLQVRIFDTIKLLR